MAAEKTYVHFREGEVGTLTYETIEAGDVDGKIIQAVVIQNTIQAII